MHTGRGELLTACGGGEGSCLQSASATSIVSQETSHVTCFSGGKPDEAWCFGSGVGVQESADASSDATESSWDEEV